MVSGCGYGGYYYDVVVLNLFIIVLCGFVYFYNVWGCVCVGFVLYGSVIRFCNELYFYTVHKILPKIEGL